MTSHTSNSKIVKSQKYNPLSFSLLRLISLFLPKMLIGILKPSLFAIETPYFFPLNGSLAYISIVPNVGPFSLMQ
jgi:hypothetical protein